MSFKRDADQVIWVKREAPVKTAIDQCPFIFIFVCHDGPIRQSGDPVMDIDRNQMELAFFGEDVHTQACCRSWAMPPRTGMPESLSIIEMVRTIGAFDALIRRTGLAKPSAKASWHLHCAA